MRPTRALFLWVERITYLNTHAFECLTQNHVWRYKMSDNIPSSKDLIIDSEMTDDELEEIEEGELEEAEEEMVRDPDTEDQ
jgi:hypothetical protein